MRISEFHIALREEFFRALESKTGWGRNEIKEAFNIASGVVIARMLDGAIAKEERKQ